MVRKQRSWQFRSIFALLGGIFLGLSFMWLGWSIFLQPNNGHASWTLPGLTHAVSPELQSPSLLAVGITLGRTNEKPVVSQQQALILAGQLEAEAANKAQSSNARYVLLNYPATSGASNHVVINNVPVWMILYQQIPLQPADADVDPTPFPQSHHDLYVFLDAKTGNELLSIWS